MPHFWDYRPSSTIISFFENLLKEGVNVNETNVSGETALHILVKSRDENIELLEWLVAHGADVNLKNNNGDSALFLALRIGILDKVNYLLKNGAEADDKFINQIHEVFWALLNSNNIELIERIIHLPQFDIERGRPGNVKRYPLNFAIQYGNPEIVRMILANPRTEINPDEAPPLIYAILTRNADNVRQLLARPDINVNARLKLGYSIFDAALRSTQEIFDIVLADPRVDINQPTFSYDNPQSLAAQLKNRYALEALQARSGAGGGAGGAGAGAAIWPEPKGFRPGQLITYELAGSGWPGSDAWEKKIVAYEARQAQIAKEERNSMEAIAALMAAEGWAGGGRRKNRNKKLTRKSKRRGSMKRTRSFYRR